MQLHDLIWLGKSWSIALWCNRCNIEAQAINYYGLIMQLAWDYQHALFQNSAISSNGSGISWCIYYPNITIKNKR